MEKKKESTVSHRERGKLEKFDLISVSNPTVIFLERIRELDSMNKRIVKNIINMKSDISEQAKSPLKNQPGRNKSEMSRIA